MVGCATLTTPVTCDSFILTITVIGCQVLGLIGCIVGATAPSINALIASNLMNGIAAAGQLSFGIIIGELVPNKLRGPAITIVFLSSLPFAGTYLIPRHSKSATNFLQSLVLQLPGHFSCTPLPNGDGVII
jgi:MFS family permease